MLLRNGSRGSQVRSLQNDIIQLGFGEFLKHYGADSIFGASTEKAVIALQKWLKVKKIDGIVGNETSGAIAKAKRDAGSKGTRNFKISEFASKDGGGLPKGGMDSNLITKLEQLRYNLGNKAIVVTSGYRTPTHNKAVGGATNSQHLYGKAADIVVRGVSASKVYATADKIFNGVGKYPNFTHVDTRANKVRF